MQVWLVGFFINEADGLSAFYNPSSLVAERTVICHRILLPKRSDQQW